jgi:hypothetical protein
MDARSGRTYRHIGMLCLRRSCHQRKQIWLAARGTLRARHACKTELMVLLWALHNVPGKPDTAGTSAACHGCRAKRAGAMQPRACVVPRRANCCSVPARMASSRRRPAAWRSASRTSSASASLTCAAARALLAPDIIWPLSAAKVCFEATVCEQPRQLRSLPKVVACLPADKRCAQGGSSHSARPPRDPGRVSCAPPRCGSAAPVPGCGCAAPGAGRQRSAPRPHRRHHRWPPVTACACFCTSASRPRAWLTDGSDCSALS